MVSVEHGLFHFELTASTAIVLLFADTIEISGAIFEAVLKHACFPGIEHRYAASWELQEAASHAKHDQ
jgi:hypothetical protein